MSDKNANNVDQIRELIFGSQIKEFEEKFHRLEEALASVEAKMERDFQEVDQKLQKETEHTFETLEKKIDNLSSISHKERSKLKEMIATNDETLQLQLETQRDEFGTKLKILKESVADETVKMQERMTRMQSEIEALLRKELGALGEEKLSKERMAQMLLDVAMKIQGTDMQALIGEEHRAEK